MKTLLRSLLLGGLMSALSLVAPAASFEGKISLKVSAGKDESQIIDYAYKDQAVRMDIATEDGSMASIIDLKKREVIMLMPEQKMYMVMSVPDIVDAAIEEASLKQQNIEKTGRTETILGYACEEYVAKERNGTTEIWMTEGLGAFTGLSAGGNPMMGGRGRNTGAAWEKAFKGRPAFPLRVVSRDSRGRETSRIEATKVERGSLPASLFQPPADYERFQLPSLGDLNPFKKKG